MGRIALFACANFVVLHLFLSRLQVDVRDYMLCTSGEKTQIWTVESKLSLLHQFDIGSKQSRVVDWNQNSRTCGSIPIRQLHIPLLE